MAQRATSSRSGDAAWISRARRRNAAVVVAALLVGGGWNVRRASAREAAEASDPAAAFAEGERAFAAGDFTRAAAAFDRAHAARPHESALWNAARSYERAGDDVRAANRYHAYLDAAPPDAPDRDRATTSLRALATRLARIDLVRSGVTDTTVDGAPVTGAVVYVAPGKHRLEAGTGESGPAPVMVEVDVAAGERRSVVLARAVPGATVPQATTAPPSPPPPVAPLAPSSPAPVWPAIVLGGLTSVSLGLSIASGVDVLIAKGDFDAEVERGASAELQRTYIDQGVGKTTRTNVLYGVTGALAIATAITIVFTVDFGETKSAATRSGGPLVAPF